MMMASPPLGDDLIDRPVATPRFDQPRRLGRRTRAALLLGLALLAWAAVGAIVWAVA